MKTLLLRARLAALLGAALMFLAPQLHAALPAHAVAFDGVNDRAFATIPNTLASNYTFGAWVFLCAGGNDAGARVGVLTGKAAGGCGSTVEVLIHSATGSAADPQFIELGRCGSFNGTLSTSAVPIKQWVHIAVTVTPGKQVSYFINSVPAGTWNGSVFNLSLSNYFTLGFNRNNSRMFNGMLGEVQIWNTNLTQAQILASMHRNFTDTRSNLVLSYLLAETGGPTLSNSAPAGSGYNGYLYNGPLRFTPTAVIAAPGVTTVAASVNTNSVVTLRGTITPKGLPGQGWFEWGTNTLYGNETEPVTFGTPQPFSFPLAGLTPGATYHYRAVAGNCLGTNFGADRTFVAPAGFGQALSLNGGGQYVSVPAGAWFSNQFTVESWVYVRSYSSWSRLFDFGNGAGDNNVLCALTDGTSGRPYFEVWNGGVRNGSILSPVTLPLNTWAHLAVVFDGTNGSILINGVAVASGAMGVPPNVVRMTNFIGRSLFGNDAYANAIFDEFRLWRTARSPAQIQANLGVSLTGNEAGLLLLYRFNEAGGAVANNSATATGAAANGTLVNGPQHLLSTVPRNMDLTVTTLADSGAGSLREAVLQANALGGAHTVTFAANLSGKTILLTGGELLLNSTLTIDASALPGGIQINGNHASRIFEVVAGTVKFSGLTLADGMTSPFDSDVETSGGAILNKGDLVVHRCIFTNNYAIRNGGALAAVGQIVGQSTLVTESTFIGNRVGKNGNGNAIANGVFDDLPCVMTVRHCTFTGNIPAPADLGTTIWGGAVFNSGTALVLEHCTITGNRADAGGGIYHLTGSTSVRHCLIADNVDGNGYDTVADDAGNPMRSGGFNLIGRDAGGNGFTQDVNGDLVGTPDHPFLPHLGPLQNNGGPTPTMLPLPGSRAIDAGDPLFSGPPFTDQRGAARVSGARLDIGAVESSAPCLRAYYSFDNRTAVDETGNSTATYGGNCAPQWDADHSGRAESAAVNNYNCQDRYLIQTAAHPGNANLDLGLKGSFTVSAWIYPTDTVGDKWVLGNDGPGGSGTLHLGLRGGRAYFAFWANDLAGNQDIPIGQWTHLAFTYNLQGGIMAIYVNGRLDASETGHPNTLGDHDLFIGWRAATGGSSYFAGRIDDLAIYCQTLAPNQVAALASDSVKPDEQLPSPDLPLPAPNGCVWSVREIYGHPLYPNNITDAEYIAHTAGLGTFIDYQSDVINFSDPQTSGDNNGFIGGDRPYRSNNLTPQGLINGDDDNFVLVARTTLVITEEDDYTFGFSSNDGARLRVKGAVFKSSTDLNGENPADPAHHGDTLSFADPTGGSDTLGVAHLAPGAYEIEFLTWEGCCGAHSEVFYARGAKTDFDSSFRLLGYNGPSALTVTVTPFVQIITNGAAPRTVRFTAQAAGGYGENSYHWFFNGGNVGGNVSGANSPTLTITGATEANAGEYSVFVGNALDATVSYPAFLIFKNNVAPDNQKPSLTITSPAPASLRVLSNSIRLAGTASDNGTLKGVYVAVGSGPYLPATGLGNWSLTLPLTPGTNVFRVVAVDEAGNVSAPQTRTVYYAVSNLLTVAVSPGGSVAPNLNNRMLQVGRNYSLRATAAKGYVFSNWTGGVLCSGPLINFPMSPGLALQANFVPNPFKSRAGSYSGLLHEFADLRHDRSGFCSALVTDKGGYSGYVKIDGRKLKFSGKFDLGGFATNRLARTGTNALVLELQFDPNGPPQILGRLTDGHWIANLIADLAPVVPKGKTVPLAGKYTFVWYFNRDNAGAGSVGSIIVSTKSQATILTTFADGSTTTQSVPMPTNGPVPFYVDLYKGKGSALGWLHLNRSAPRGGAVFGRLNWYRPAMGTSGLFTNGFEFMHRTYGSTYVSPTNNRVLNFTNAMLGFGLLDQGVVFRNPLRLGSGGKVVNLATNAMKMSVNLANGLYSGTTVEPGTGRAVQFKGAVFQDWDYGDGWFLTPEKSGYLSLGADSP